VPRVSLYPTHALTRTGWQRPVITVREGALIGTVYKPGGKALSIRGVTAAAARSFAFGRLTTPVPTPRTSGRINSSRPCRCYRRATLPRAISLVLESTANLRPAPVHDDGLPDGRPSCLIDGRRVHPLIPVLAPGRSSCSTATPFRPMKPRSTWPSIRARSATYASGPPARTADSACVSTRKAQAARPEIPASARLGGASWWAWATHPSLREFAPAALLRSRLAHGGVLS
jgi:hypothetical protein